jgi:hypothetical protein
VKCFICIATFLAILKLPTCFLRCADFRTRQPPGQSLKPNGVLVFKHHVLKTYHVSRWEHAIFRLPTRREWASYTAIWERNRTGANQRPCYIRGEEYTVYPSLEWNRGSPFLGHSLSWLGICNVCETDNTCRSVVCSCYGPVAISKVPSRRDRQASRHLPAPHYEDERGLSFCLMTSEIPPLFFCLLSDWELNWVTWGIGSFATSGWYVLLQIWLDSVAC